MSRNEPSIGIERYMQIRSSNSPVFDKEGVLYFLSNISGIPQVWRIADNVPWPEQVTFFPDRVMGIHPAPNTEQLCVSADIGGNENAQLYLMDMDGLDIRDVSSDPQHIYRFGEWSKSHQFSFSTNRRNGRDFDIYVCDTVSGEQRAVHVSDFTNNPGPVGPLRITAIFVQNHRPFVWGQHR